MVLKGRTFEIETATLRKLFFLFICNLNLLALYLRFIAFSNGFTPI